MALLSSVHYGENVSNAFWDGRQTVFGDGENPYFHRFTRALDVAAHEMTHGVINFSSRLEYHDQPGALNESFCDVMGALVEQWHRKESAQDASWCTGRDLIGPDLGTHVKGIRTFREDKAFEGHPVLGTDPQPKHFNEIFTGTADNGGVHINSGIPNHAFYRLARSLGGNAWEKAGSIWYELMIGLAPQAGFVDAARRSYEIAGRRYGVGSREQKAVSEGWQAVGIGL